MKNKSILKIILLAVVFVFLILVVFVTRSNLFQEKSKGSLGRFGCFKDSDCNLVEEGVCEDRCEDDVRVESFCESKDKVVDERPF